jgi:hypothetical protein
LRFALDKYHRIVSWQNDLGNVYASVYTQNGSKVLLKRNLFENLENQEGVFGTGHCSMTLKSNRPHHHQYDILLRSWSFFRGEILYCLHRSLMHLLLAQIKLLLPFTPIWIIRTIDSTATLAFGDAASFFRYW